MSESLSKERLVTADQAHRSSRLAFLDPIRVALTLLVILHHTCITYGGSGSWYYKEADAPELARLLLTMFTATNQSFFMGFFFLIAAYLMPQALERKGVTAYVSDRAIRLGVPIFLFGYFLDPLANALATGARSGDVVGELLMRIQHNDFGLGPLWFNQALMIGALVWIFTPIQTHVERLLNQLPGPHRGIALAVLVWALMAFILRLVVPVGQNIFGMQLGYFASYIILFFGGAWAAQHRLLERVTLDHAWPWIIVSVLSFPTLWIFAVQGGKMATQGFLGGWNIAALIYAAWEPLVATGVIVGTLAIARRVYPVGKPRMTRFARASYAAFIIHPPLVVVSSWLVQDWASTGILRFLLAGPIACLLAFAIGDALTRCLARIPVTRPERVTA